jgi:hypothetical protein
MDIPDLGQLSQAMPSTTYDGNSGPQIRLVVCKNCKTIDELPDYQGNPANDVLLEITVGKHQNSMGITHVGQMFRVPLAVWSDTKVRDEILRQISEGTKGLAEIDEQFYDSRSTFFEDAMSCFQKHRRPQYGCSDWRADDKRLVPDTSKERKDLGLAKVTEAGPKVYLCDFCPVRMYYEGKARAEAGQYS